MKGTLLVWRAPNGRRKDMEPGAIFNNQAGNTRKDDTLPGHFFEGEGAINKKEFEDALDEYYCSEDGTALENPRRRK